ncbi:DUF1488 domain-containing protein [Vibrio sp. Of7-15]|uniref:DUF1488 domain-containing protein n=1 Tax=Vibrio sp. Of7-15 TaxID=2724879 RepID=UPI001EF1B71E|nr:DUF1488 domain-containing protein [Vibrio sp. Of7-15]MCG7499242.1 DUF1488 domain-containing protein [Vibrio sp. Of7-15]
MNQNILFPDDQTWDVEREVICFPAQQAGSLIQCVVDKEWLEKVSGSVIDDSAQALEAFSQCRFDAEDEAEALIEDESFNSSGEIEIKL